VSTAAGLRTVLDWCARTGRKPFRYQRQAWRAFLAGESGLIHAPTGFGKTLAAWLGPVARACQDAPSEHLPATPNRENKHGPPLRVLWITPLRALANNTVEALREPINDLGLPWTVELRTGDVSSAVRLRQKRRLPTALVTTPESLSLLLSYADAAERFRTLECVVVDEWHELLGSKRGVQTELALARLRRWKPGLSVWGLSATLGNLNQARDVLLGSGARGRIIAGPRQKRIEMVTLFPDDIQRFPWAGHLGDQLVRQLIERIEAARTTLLFTNTRSQAELWRQAILRARPDWIDQVGIHHGSLERAIRSGVEQLLSAGDLRCVVCTSSMDLGVDFAPVDQVVQLGSPKGIARLMQRAGRSGHQPGATSRILCVPTHAFELVEFAAARAGVQARDLEARLPLEKPLDVLTQHLVTLAASGGFVADELKAEVRATWAYRDLTDEEWAWCLDFLTRGGKTLGAYPEHHKLRANHGHYTVSTPRIERMHRMSIGTITSDSAMRVRMQRGAVLGTIEESFIARLKPGDVFVFAGRLVELARVRELTATVRPAKRKRGIVPRWQGGRFPLSTHLADRVRRQLAAAREGRYQTRELRVLRPLFELQARWSRIPAADEVLIEHTRTREGMHWFVFPFEGRLVHEGLAALVAYRLSRRAAATIQLAGNDYGFELLPSDSPELDTSAWRALLSPDHLAEDLLACVNATQMARRQFREIARVAGLIFQGYPGQHKAARHLQASSELFFDVFSEYDPENLLLTQARREVLQQQLEFHRLETALTRIAESELVIVESQRLSPLAFPLWAERLRAQYVSSEKWSDRVERMAQQLARAADGGKSPRRAVAQPR
jgi:ATP-dependent Lhr-like helicase